MNPIYLETHFHAENEGYEWPASFAIITAYATTGELWTIEANQVADAELQRFLIGKDCLLGRVTGYSPATGHAEPGWAAQLGWEEACDVGRTFKQDAIYVVLQDVLFVTYCDTRRGLVKVARFNERLTGKPHSHQQGQYIAGFGNNGL
jgi:hypothetical protein